MDDLAAVNVGPGVLLAISVVCLLSSAVWGLICIQLARRKPLVPYEPRQPAPWRAFDMLMIVLSFFVFTFSAQFAALTFLPAELTKPLAEGQLATGHGIMPLLSHGGTFGLLLAALLAIIVAPIIEEFLFRLVLQGGLESMVHRRPGLPGWLGSGIPIVLPAILFASLHFRSPSPEYPWQYAAALMIGAVVGAVASLIFSLVWLRVRCGVTLEDLGFVPGRLLGDARIGAMSLLAFIVPVYLVQGAVALTLMHFETALDRPMPAPDPVAIFLFAIVWGVLYRRTHRLVPSLVAHALLNTLSLGLALGLMRGV
jgi:membrane protease YdiL (CAAX protease family)